jgi:hypothetical protein
MPFTSLDLYYYTGEGPVLSIKRKNRIAAVFLLITLEADQSIVSFL